jgi:hypothetical protein
MDAPEFDCDSRSGSHEHNTSNLGYSDTYGHTLRLGGSAGSEYCVDRHIKGPLGTTGH